MGISWKFQSVLGSGTIPRVKESDRARHSVFCAALNPFAQDTEEELCSFDYTVQKQYYETIWKRNQDVVRYMIKDCDSGRQNHLQSSPTQQCQETALIDIRKRPSSRWGWSHRNECNSEPPRGQSSWWSWSHRNEFNSGPQRCQCLILRKRASRRWRVSRMNEDWRLQRTVEQACVDRAEIDEIALQKWPEGMCEQFGAHEMAKLIEAAGRKEARVSFWFWLKRAGKVQWPQSEDWFPDFRSLFLYFPSHRGSSTGEVSRRLRLNSWKINTHFWSERWHSSHSERKLTDTNTKDIERVKDGSNKICIREDLAKENMVFSKESGQSIFNMGNVELIGSQRSSAHHAFATYLREHFFADEAVEMSQIRFRDKVVDSSCPTENRQQRTDAARAVPESSEGDRDSTGTAGTGNDAIGNQTHEAGKDLWRARHSQSGRQSLEHRMSPVRVSRDHLSRLDQAGTGDAGGNRAHQSCGELAEWRRPAEQNQFDATKSNQIATVLNNIHQFKIPAHMLNRSRSVQEINKRISDKRSTSQRLWKPKERKNFRKLEAEMVDVMDTLQYVTSIIEKEMANNSTFLQKGIDTRNTDNAMVTLIMTKTSMSGAFSEQWWWSAPPSRSSNS